MSEIYIKKIDETTMLVDGDRGALQEMSDYFSFMADGYRYAKAFRNHMWDGRIRLVNLRNSTTLVGLYAHIIKFCADRNYAFIDQTEQHLKPHTDDISDFDQWVQSLNLPFEPREYQLRAAKYAIQASRGLLLSPTGCHAKGTKVVMSDGSLKSVEHVEVGDFLMGVDGQSREVLRLYNGVSEMYKIQPKRSASFIVNGDHVLALWNCVKKQLEFCEVQDYVKKTNNYKHIHFLVTNKEPKEFNDNDLPLDPYFVGLYLGDGHCDSCTVTTADKEIVDYLYRFCDENQLTIREQAYPNSENTISLHLKDPNPNNGNKNIIIEKFRSLGLSFGNRKNITKTTCATKFIPELYLTASIKQRFELLAGLIDTDGYLSHNSYYEFVSKSKQLVEDVRRLAYSLGYNSSFAIKKVNGIDYYKLNILGDIRAIPVRVHRKKCTKVYNRNKDPRHETFKVESVGEGEYYGFGLSGDHLYYTDNWIINHNSGKSLIFYMLVRWMLKHDRKVCLVVPSTSLVEQMISDFKEYAANDDSFDVAKQVHGLHSKIKTTDPYTDQCVVSTWQSLIKYDKTLFETWDAVFVDEAHSCVAKSLNAVVGGAVNARYKIGMTGSLSSCVCHEFQITGLLGSVYQVTTTKQLQEKGQLNQLEVYMVNMKYPADESKQLWKETKELKKTYLDELDFINHHVKRQLFIRNLACSLKGTTLILFRLREHGDWLYKLIKEKVGDQRPVFHIDGKVDAKTREAIRTSINKGNENPILVFSVSTSATGLNLPKCENLILSPTKSKITTLQAVGRILRLAKDKGTSKVFDLVDDLRTGRRINHTYKHAQERLQIYSEQGFNVDFKEVQF